MFPPTLKFITITITIIIIIIIIIIIPPFQQRTSHSRNSPEIQNSTSQHRRAPVVAYQVRVQGQVNTIYVREAHQRRAEPRHSSERDRNELGSSTFFPPLKAPPKPMEGAVEIILEKLNLFFWHVWKKWGWVSWCFFGIWSLLFFVSFFGSGGGACFSLGGRSRIFFVSRISALWAPSGNENLGFTHLATAASC